MLGKSILLKFLLLDVYSSFFCFNSRFKIKNILPFTPHPQPCKRHNTVFYLLRVEQWENLLIRKWWSVWQAGPFSRTYILPLKMGGVFGCPLGFLVPQIAPLRIGGEKARGLGLREGHWGSRSEEEGGILPECSLGCDTYLGLDVGVGVGNHRWIGSVV